MYHRFFVLDTLNCSEDRVIFLEEGQTNKIPCSKHSATFPRFVCFYKKSLLISISSYNRYLKLLKVINFSYSSLKIANPSYKLSYCIFRGPRVSSLLEVE